ncbi:protein SAAL1 [Prorops nasuta]|uniref:protein SAAL1 n=1 Tax=Prorops nasuta TaxID=863751 RepID=UPI0034CEFA49
MDVNMDSEQGENNDKEKDENVICSNMIEAQDMNTDEMDTMKGDTVGDTVYSAKWIINTLLSLSKVNVTGWSNQLETDLCTLWDITAEKDIVAFLMNIDFINITSLTLETSEESRLIEILVGIIGNMCCQESAIEKIGNEKELVTLILNLLSTDDTEILIQVLRFLQAAVWDIQKNSKSVWIDNLKQCEILEQVLVFVLKSSTNDDLLGTTITLLHSITEIEFTNKTQFFKNFFNKNELITALIESFLQMIPKDETIHSEKSLKIIENWLGIVCNIMKMEVLEFDSSETDERFLNIINILLNILYPYRHVNNLISIEENAALSIYKCVDMAFQFQINGFTVDCKLNSTILNILYSLKIAMNESTGINDEQAESIEIIKELHKYLENYCLKLLDICTDDEIIKVLKISKEKITKYFIQFIKIHEKTSEDNVKKLNAIENVLQKN